MGWLQRIPNTFLSPAQLEIPKDRHLVPVALPPLATATHHFFGHPSFPDQTKHNPAISIECPKSIRSRQTQFDSVHSQGPTGCPHGAPPSSSSPPPPAPEARSRGAATPRQRWPPHGSGHPGAGEVAVGATPAPPTQKKGGGGKGGSKTPTMLEVHEGVRQVKDQHSLSSPQLNGAHQRVPIQKKKTRKTDEPPPVALAPVPAAEAALAPGPLARPRPATAPGEGCPPVEKATPGEGGK